MAHHAPPNHPIAKKQQREKDDDPLKDHRGMLLFFADYFYSNRYGDIDRIDHFYDKSTLYILEYLLTHIASVSCTQPPSAPPPPPRTAPPPPPLTAPSRRPKLADAAEFVLHTDRARKNLAKELGLPLDVPWAEIDRMEHEKAKMMHRPSSFAAPGPENIEIA